MTDKPETKIAVKDGVATVQTYSRWWLRVCEHCRGSRKVEGLRHGPYRGAHYEVPGVEMYFSACRPRPRTRGSRVRLRS